MKHCKAVVTDSLRHLPESVTFCATVNEAGDEQVITDMMIRRACEQIEDSQIWPYSPANVLASSVTEPSDGFASARVLSSQSAIIIQFPAPVSR